jgi:hypothetical protein
MERIGNPEPAKRGRSASERAPHERRRANSKRTSTCVPNMNSKPHCEAAALGAAAGSLIPNGVRYGVPAAPWLLTRTTRVPVVLSLKGIGATCMFPQSTAHQRGRRVRKPHPPRSRHHPIVIVSSETSSGRQVRGGRAGCPNATQPEPLTVSVLFIRPRTRNWQAACGIWLNRDSFALPARIFCGHLGLA